MLSAVSTIIMLYAAISFAIICTSSQHHNVFAFSPPITTTKTPASSSLPNLVNFHDNKRQNVGGFTTTASTLYMATTNNSNNKKKKQGSAKRRRFLQQAHPLPSTTTSTGGTSTTQQQNGAADNLSSLTGASDSNNSDNSNKKQQRRGPPLQTSKSIEELESILEKRWGTSTTSTASLSINTKKISTTNTKVKEGADADFVLSFDTSDEYEYDNSSSSNKRTKTNKFENTNSLKGAAVFRNANRVRDPWAVEEGLYSNSNDDNVAVEGSSSSGSSTPRKKNRKRDQQQQEMYDPNEIMLNRVRINQERLQQQPPNKKNNKKNKNIVEEVPMIDIMARDYYDEDDEGYESKSTSSSTNKKNMKQGTSLISPKPVGGSGGGGSSSLSSGIFKSRSNNNENDSTQTTSTFTTTKRKKDQRRRGLQSDGGKDQQLVKKKKQRKEQELKSKMRPTLLDEEGNEMYLTLNQADKIVQRILLANNKDTVVTSDDDDDINNGNIIQETEGTSLSWEDIGITDSKLLSNLNEMICPTPLNVQTKSCPSIVSGNDVLISTHTGSGKTLAFLVPIAQRLLIAAAAAASSNKNTPGASGAYPKAIIVAPGRELSSQIVSVAQSLFANTGLTVSLAIGGTPYSRNVDTIRKKKPSVVVGTPGRIAELIIGRPGEKSGKLKLSGLTSVVLDEFDALLQYDSHKEPTVAIMNAMERQHGSTLQRILCSATATDMIGQQTTQGDVKNGDKSGTRTNIEDYLRQGYAHASVDDNDLLVTSGGVHASTATSNKSGGSTTARVSRTTIHGTLHVPHQRLALEAVRKILNTDPIPQQALIFVDSPRRVDIVIEKVRSFFLRLLLYVGIARRVLYIFVLLYSYHIHVMN